uniref:Pentacotripeptide-repeat region of PRORP domain-containing protein n=1 Tax=Oryza glumipatula TaxID=40148 RepID=A0A0E0B5Q1_9ORYZ
MLPSPPAPPPISPARLHKLVTSQTDPLLALELVTVTAPTTAPHPSTLHALALRLSRRREHLPHALALLRRLPSPPSPRILLPLLLSALRLRRQPHLFLSTFNSLFVSGPSPLPLHSELLLRLLSVLSSTASYFPCALHLLRDVSTRLPLPEPLVLASHNLLIEAAARSGHLAVSISLFHRLRSLHVSPNAETYRILTQSLCRRGQVRTAANLLDEMLHRGIPADPLAYTTVLNALCRKKQLREAYRLLCLMRGREVSPDIVHYNTVIVGMCREGRPLDACKVFRDMRESGCAPNAVAYTAVVNRLCVSGLYDKAEAYLDDMLGKGLLPHFSVFHSVIKGCCAVGKVNEAAGMMTRMLDLGMVPHAETWSSVIRSVCSDEDNVEVRRYCLTSTKQELTQLSEGSAIQHGDHLTANMGSSLDVG